MSIGRVVVVGCGLLFLLHFAPWTDVGLEMRSHECWDIGLWSLVFSTNSKIFHLLFSKLYLTKKDFESFLILHFRNFDNYRENWFIENMFSINRVLVSRKQHVFSKISTYRELLIQEIPTRFRPPILQIPMSFPMSFSTTFHEWYKSHKIRCYINC